MGAGVFDEMAARYDTEERDRVAGVIADKLRQSLGQCGDKTGLDYGCGTGLVGLRLAGCFKTLLMVDAAPGMVAQVRRKIEAGRLANVEALCADFSRTVPAGLCVDVVIMAQVLLHIPDTLGILRRLHSVLNPGGRLLAVDFDRDEGIVHEKVHGGFVQADLMALAKRAGFSGARAETFYRGQNLFMGRDASLFLLECVRP